MIIYYEGTQFKTLYFTRNKITWTNPIIKFGSVSDTVFPFSLIMKSSLHFRPQSAPGLKGWTVVT